MKPYYLFFGLALSVCLSACHADSAPRHTTDQQTPTIKSAVTPSAAATATSGDDQLAILGSKLKPGMAYSSFRKIVLDQGWQPLPDAKCMANVVGGNYEKLCSEHPELGSCKACTDVPELSACSGDGYCLMQFSRTGSDQILQAGTYGEISDWNAPSARSQLELSHWEFSSTPAR